MTREAVLLANRLLWQGGDDILLRRVMTRMLEAYRVAPGHDEYKFYQFPDARGEQRRAARRKAEK